MEDSQIANTRPYFGFASALSITSPSYSNGNGFSTTINESLILEQSPPPYVYFAKNNTLTFMSLDPHITILTAGRSTLKKFNITTDAFPSWVHGPVFVVYGHVDPTLVFLSGAEVNATVINIDGDMLHNFACTSASYAGVALASIQPLMFRTYPSNGTIVVHGSSISFKLPPGNYTYFSAIKGQNQAQAFGMYGEMESVPSV